MCIKKKKTLSFQEVISHKTGFNPFAIYMGSVRLSSVIVGPYKSEHKINSNLLQINNVKLF